MMMCQKRKPTLDENQVVTDGYELGDTSADVMGECESLGSGKWQWMDSLHHQTTSTWLDKILTSLEKCQENCQKHQENLAAQSQTCNIQHELCNTQGHAVDIQECTSMALVMTCSTLVPTPSLHPLGPGPIPDISSDALRIASRDPLPSHASARCAAHRGPCGFSYLPYRPPYCIKSPVEPRSKISLVIEYHRRVTLPTPHS